MYLPKEPGKEAPFRKLDLSSLSGGGPLIFEQVGPTKTAHNVNIISVSWAIPVSCINMFKP